MMRMKQYDEKYETKYDMMRKNETIFDRMIDDSGRMMDEFWVAESRKTRNMSM